VCPHHRSGSREIVPSLAITEFTKAEIPAGVQGYTQFRSIWGNVMESATLFCFPGCWLDVSVCPAELVTGFPDTGRLTGTSSIPDRIKNLYFSISSRPALQPTQPSFQCVLGVLSRGVKRQAREADKTHPTRMKVKKK
jgi:hypothetical protein